MGDSNLDLDDANVLVFPFPVTDQKEVTQMTVDLPPNVAAQLQVESIGNIQSNNRDGRNVATAAMGVLQAAAARNFDELGAVESRATSGVMATPIASPTTGG